MNGKLDRRSDMDEGALGETVKISATAPAYLLKPLTSKNKGNFWSTPNLANN